MQWVVGLILHGPLELFFFCSSLCPKTGVTKVMVSTILSGMLYIKKKNLLLIGKSSSCSGGSRLRLGKWSFTI